MGISSFIVAAILFYEVKVLMLRIPVLRVLHERGTMDLTGIIKALKEVELYPRYTPEFLVLPVCEAGIKKGLITPGGHAFIPRYKISAEGYKVLDEYDWRKGNKKFPAQ